MSAADEDVELRRRLGVIWLNKDQHRYVPKAINRGSGWGVFDRKLGRILKNREVKKLSFDDCNETLTN